MGTSVAVPWTVVVLLGAIVLWPQPGYIHPDEFFQSTEIVAGDLLNISHLRTWEFDGDTALRDISVPYLLYAPGLWALGWLLGDEGMTSVTTLSGHQQGLESYAVLVIPRVTLALAGLLHLCLVHRLCTVFGVDRGRASWLWVTSYVPWTFLTRPFSNTVETLLFSAFLLLLLGIAQCCHADRSSRSSSKSSSKKAAAADTATLQSSAQAQGESLSSSPPPPPPPPPHTSIQQSQLKSRRQQSHTNKQQPSPQGSSTKEERQTIRTTDQEKLPTVSKTVAFYSFLLGAVACCGLFNRPTFAVFVFAPLLWGLDQVNMLCRTRAQAALLTLAGAGFLLTFTAMTLANSFYYNSDFGHLLNDLYAALAEGDSDVAFHSAREVVKGLRIPPWSFVLYNTQAENLSEHGLHPWYTHLLVQLPSLLGPLCVLLYADVAGMVARWRRTHPADVLYFMVLTPVLSLSFFPHQEARFLLPVVPLALACMAGHPWLGWKSVKVILLLFNLIGLVGFGWLHQGGVIPALSSLQVDLKEECVRHYDINNYHAPSTSSSYHPDHRHPVVRTHILSYCTYMLPRHLLFSRPSCEAVAQVHVHDMIGTHNDPSALRSRLEELNRGCLQDSIPCRFWLLLPYPALPDLTSALEEGWVVEGGGGSFCPHVSTERLPTVVSLQTMDNVHHLLSQLCLKIVTVQIP